jgi:serine/threonine-protein kinase
MLYQLKGELVLAESAFRRELQRWPERMPALLGLGRNLVLQSNPKEALSVFERCPDEDKLWGRAVALQSLKDDAGSRQALRKLAASKAHTDAYGIASAFAWRGEKDAAFEWLERAYAQHDGSLVAMLKADPFLRGLRADARYAALVRKMRLPVP